MDYLKLVADKTIAEKYEIENFVFDFFDRIDDMCYVKPSYIQAIDKYKRIDMRYDAFDWQTGVGFFSLIEANKRLKDDKYTKFIKDWVDFHIKKGLPKMTVNSMISYYVVLQIYKKYGGRQYYSICEGAAQYLISEGVRADEGAFEHTVLEVRNASQIWSDTTFMAGIFLAEWGIFTGNIIYQNEAARQLLLHYKYLTDKGTGLMFHAYSCFERNNLSCVRWGRANGWGIISCVEILDRLPEFHKLRSGILQRLQTHIDCLIKYQCDNGGWHTVVDNPDTYIETTAACCVYYAVKKAVKRGYIKGNYTDTLNKAEEYIISRIQENGEVKNASAGTPVMANEEEYNKIPCEMSYYGQGLALLALSQL